MPAAPRLTDQELAEHLRSLPAWEHRDGRLVRTLRFRDFREALSFVERIADPADAQDHHPDATIHWNQLTLTLWTHASGGITARDIRLAETIEALLAAP